MVDPSRTQTHVRQYELPLLSIIVNCSLHHQKIIALVAGHVMPSLTLAIYNANAETAIYAISIALSFS